MDVDLADVVDRLCIGIAAATQARQAGPMDKPASPAAMSTACQAIDKAVMKPIEPGPDGGERSRGCRVDAPTASARVED
jgi:hypothetical protein